MLGKDAPSTGRGSAIVQEMSSRRRDRLQQLEWFCNFTAELLECAAPAGAAAHQLIGTHTKPILARIAIARDTFVVALPALGARHLPTWPKSSANAGTGRIALRTRNTMKIIGAIRCQHARFTVSGFRHANAGYADQTCSAIRPVRRRASVVESEFSDAGPGTGTRIHIRRLARISDASFVYALCVNAREPVAEGKAASVIPALPGLP